MEDEELLLDTHLLLWSAEDPARLSRKARKLLSNPDHRLVFSAVSIWEIGIKHALVRPDFTFEPALVRSALLREGFRELPLNGEQALSLASLPPLHRDPFDRILVAQALSEHLTLVTSDKIVARYPGKIILV